MENQSSFAVKVAKAFSVIFQPFFMPVYALLFLFNGNSMFAALPTATKLYCFGMTLLFLLLLPMAAVAIFKRFGLVTNYGLHERQERIYPLLTMIICTFAAFWLLRLVPYTQVVQQLFLVLVLLLSVFSIITLRWKISMHTMALGALCGFLLVLGTKYPGDMRGPFIWSLIISGIVGSCRIYLRRHTPAQVYAGFLLGCLVIFGVMG